MLAGQSVTITGLRQSRDVERRGLPARGARPTREDAGDTGGFGTILLISPPGQEFAFSS